MIQRKMIVEERLEKADQTSFELRHKTAIGSDDDRMTVVILAGEMVPAWKVGQRVNVTVEVEG